MQAVLIITADDFGYDSDRNRGIVECYRNGAITRASLLVNGSASQEAANLARMFGIPIGLHLNLTEGIPVCAQEEVSSLLTKNGHFLGKHGFRDVLKAGGIVMDEVRNEIEAQITKFKSLTENQLPGHVDGHQHVHVLPEVCSILSEILSREQITSVRLPAETGLESCSWIPETSLGFYKSVAAQSLEAKNCFTRHNISFPDRFLGMSTMGNWMNITRLQQAISACFSEPLSTETKSARHAAVQGEAAQTTCELMVHPGYHCSDVEAGGCGTGADEFSTSVDREHEMQVLSSDEMKQFYKWHNIQLSC